MAFTNSSSEETRSNDKEAAVRLWAALVPAAGLILIGVIPGYLKDLYTVHTDNLMRAYVTAGYTFLATVFCGLAVMMFRDWTALSRSTKTFRFSPATTASEEAGLGMVKVRSRHDEQR